MENSYTIIHMIPETRVLYAKYHYSTYPHGMHTSGQRNTCFLPVVGYAHIVFESGNKLFSALTQGKTSIHLEWEWEDMAFDCFVQEPKG